MKKPYLIDTADTNTKGTTLEIGTVQKVTHHQNNLRFFFDIQYILSIKTKVTYIKEIHKCL
jgi:hypothetical protein